MSSIEFSSSLFAPTSGSQGEPLPPPTITTKMRLCLELRGRSDFSFYRGINDADPRHQRRELDAGVQSAMRKVDKWETDETAACDSRVAQIEVELDLLPKTAPTEVVPVVSRSSTISETTVLEAWEERRALRAMNDYLHQEQRVKGLLKEKADLEIGRELIVVTARHAISAWRDWWKQIVEIYTDAATMKQVKAENMQEIPERLRDDPSSDGR